MQTLNFKFKYVGEDGEPEGFMSKKATFDGETLTLDDSSIPIELVLKAERRSDKLLLQVLQEDGPVVVVIAVTGGKIREVNKAINLHSSRGWAQIHKDTLEKRGMGALFKMENCPACGAAIHLSGSEDTPQIFCLYCDALFTKADRKRKSIALTLCDECGFYSNPKPFTTFYFYFLLIIYGYRYQKHHMCHSCMRGEAWKMFFANFLFVLGVPVAITQLFRAYLGGTGGSLPGLDTANSLAKKGNYPKAKAIYEGLKDDPNHAAGILYNMALAALQVDQEAVAIDHLWAALKQCGNYSPAYNLLSVLYENADSEGDKARLEEFWDSIPEEEIDDDDDAIVTEAIDDIAEIE